MKCHSTYDSYKQEIDDNEKVMDILKKARASLLSSWPSGYDGFGPRS
jgi:hypothetical protein